MTVLGGAIEDLTAEGDAAAAAVVLETLMLLTKTGAETDGAPAPGAGTKGG